MSDQSKKRALMADEEANWRLKPERRLLRKKFRFHVDLALDGKEAREKLRSVQYDLVVLDQAMPDPEQPQADVMETGLRVLQELRNADWETKSKVPVVVLSAVPDEQLKKKCLEKDAVWVTKPATPDEFQEAVRCLMPAKEEHHEK